MDECICVGCSRALNFLDGILFYVQHVNIRREARVAIFDNSRLSELREFKDISMVGPLGCSKTFALMSATSPNCANFVTSMPEYVTFFKRIIALTSSQTGFYSELKQRYIYKS